MPAWGSDLWAMTAPLATAALSVVVFYLRSIREHQIERHAELLRRLERAEEDAARMRSAVRDVQRAFTTKEEWLRETMLARRRLDALMRAVARLEAQRGRRDAASEAARCREE